MRHALRLLLFLSGIFLVTEIVFNYIALTQDGGNPFGTFVKTGLLLVFIFLFSKKLKWVRSILSTIMVVYGLLCLVAGLESGPIFYAIGLYDIFFGIYLYKSHALALFRYGNNDYIESEEPSKPHEKPEPFTENGWIYRYMRQVRRSH
jgi:hypothetical protein